MPRQFHTDIPNESCHTNSVIRALLLPMRGAPSHRPQPTRLCASADLNWHANPSQKREKLIPP
jgi:hypothetical protein